MSGTSASKWHLRQLIRECILRAMKLDNIGSNRFDLEYVDRRIDKALLQNRRDALVFISMAVGIFLLGASTVIVGYWRLNPYVGTGALLFQTLLCWPANKILILRRDNIMLQTLPALASRMPSDEAVEMIKKALFEILWKK